MPVRRRYAFPLKHDKVSSSRGDSQRGRFMTVCVAALGSGGATIVCVADKALSYGDYIQWDSDSTKLVPLGTGDTVALVAGTELYITRFLGRIEKWDGFAGEREEIKRFLEDEFQKCLIEMQNVEVLLPHALTRPEYVAAISGGDINQHIESVATKMAKFDFDCQLLVCGYDCDSKPYIFDVSPPGKVTDFTNTGFHAIGSGAEKAISRVLFSEHTRDHGVSQTLFDCFDAKANAEMAVGVGYAWDASFVTMRGSFTAHDGVKPLIEKVWSKFSRSPFAKRNKDDLPDPPTNWQSQLREFIQASFFQKSPDGWNNRQGFFHRDAFGSPLLQPVTVCVLPESFEFLPVDRCEKYDSEDTLPKL